MKIKQILAITILALISASCSMALLNDADDTLDGEYKIIVNGIVSDVESNEPIQGISITFNAYAENSLSVMPVTTKATTTNANGVYNLRVSGFSEPVRCEITAESTDATESYETLTNKIVVTWTGNSYDPDNMTFYVNDCNFQMEKN